MSMIQVFEALSPAAHVCPGVLTTPGGTRAVP